MDDPQPFEIEVEDLERLLRSETPPTVLDVREPWETDICAIDGSLPIPLGQLPQRFAEVPTDGTVVVCCHHGARSARATAWLRARGVPGAINLAGGIDAWARRIDPTMRTYG